METVPININKTEPKINAAKNALLLKYLRFG